MFLKKTIIFLHLLCSLTANNINYRKASFGNDFSFTISHIHQLIQSKEVRCSQIIDFYLQRGYVYNEDLNAVISFNPNAMVEAQYLDKFYEENESLVGKLHCVPVLIKDNIDVKNLPTSGGIKALRYSIPNQDSAIVRKLKDSGAIILAKTNLAELGLGSQYKSEMGDECKNPFDLSRSCGASSSGVGAGIAAGMALIGIGTDTDGSILDPSVNCGVYGLRLAQIETNLEGVIPFFKYQDVAGPITNNIDDMALTYSILIDDSQSYQNYMNLAKSKPNFKVAILKNFFNKYEFETSFGVYEINLEEKFKSQILTTLISLNRTVNLIEYEILPDKFAALIKLFEDLTLARLGCQSMCIKDSMNEYFGEPNRFDIDAPYHNFEAFFNSLILNPFWKSFLQASNINDEKQACQSSCVLYEDLKSQMINMASELFTDANAELLIYPTSNALPLFLNNTGDNSLGGAFLSYSTGFPSLNVPITSLDGFPLSVSVLARTENTQKLFHFTKYVSNNLYKFNLPKHTPLIKQTECSILNDSRVICQSKLRLAVILVLGLILANSAKIH